MDLITQTTKDFVEGMQKSGAFATRQIIALIKELDTQDGNIISTDRNAQLIDGVSLGIAQVAVSGAFSSRVNKVLNSIPKVRKETERSFVVQNGIIPNGVLGQLDVMETDITNFLNISLGQETIIQEVINPVSAVLANMMATNMAASDAVTLAQTKVPSLFTQYAHTRVETSLQMYVRNINKTLAAAKGVDWWFYAGPTGPSALGNPIREFCKPRVRGYYTGAEVSSWGTLTWEGQIPNTNQATIFTNLGGYNCRHELKPVQAKNVPAQSKTRARNLGY